jgi:hypothetical protein
MRDVYQEEIQTDARLWNMTGGYDTPEETTELGPAPSAVKLGVGEIALLAKSKHPNIFRTAATVSGFLAGAIAITAVRHLRTA